jgi:RNA polymerase sigma-70 factor (ECF subfamily)
VRLGVAGRTNDRWPGSTSFTREASRSSASDPDVGPGARSRPIYDAASTRGPGDQRDERAIVDAVLAGDRDAFRQLVERESASVVRACHRILGDLHEAEDAAQEAFVTAYRSLASWRGDGPFGAWPTRIAIRIALRQAGKRRSVTWLDPAGSSDPGRTDAASTASVAESVAATQRTDPAMLAVRAERAADLRGAVAALPEPYREVVILRFFGELSLDEIARETERPLATVKTHLRRGLLRLRGSIEPGGLT